MYVSNDVGIRNGHPYTHWKVSLSDERLSVDDDLLSDLPDEQQVLARIWAMAYMVPTSTANKRHTSYGLKHVLEHDMDFYLTNNQFKDLMLQMGHRPVNEHAVNWQFRISEKALNWAGSPIMCGNSIRSRPRGWMNPYKSGTEHLKDEWE